MKCKVLHETRGRLRVHLIGCRLSLADADKLEGYLSAVPGVTHAKVYDRTADAVVCYAGSRAAVIGAFARYNKADAALDAYLPAHSTRALNREFEDNLVGVTVRRFASKLFFPAPLRAVLAVIRGIRYVWKGLSALRRGKLTVEVLDATAVSVSLLRGDFKTAASVMFMLKLGEILEEWTRKKSLADLADAMSLHVDKVWRVEDGAEVLVPIGEVAAHDRIAVRTGNLIPLDGKVVSGEAAVNQASMTGESFPVQKSVGGFVYAGTVVEDGSIVIEVEKTAGGGRYDRIVKMIEDSERMKSASETRATSIADRLVPYTLGGTVLTWLLTRNVTKTLAVLMVDFSCALKLAIPIAVISAMRECSLHGITVKGGHYLETVAKADTIVFDKTGTLTYATPRVAGIVTFGGHAESEMLRLAACLEEHYPHSIANAVVAEATARGLGHEERHAEVQYVVAHGIASAVDNERVCIGSAHFIFEDEACRVPAGEEDKLASLHGEYSYLYLAIGGELAAVLCIDDPIKAGARNAIRALHDCGIGRIVMMTGDNEKTAARVAAAVGVDDFRAEVLPEDKADFVRAEREAGRTVIMVGDGVNDTPALSEANVGIAVSTGAAIAREVADVTVLSDDLDALVTLRRIAAALQARIGHNYRTIVSFNSLLILLGVTGTIQPTFSALLHNASTLAISLRSMTPLLHDAERTPNTENA